MRSCRWVALAITLCLAAALAAPASADVAFTTSGLATSGVISELNPAASGRWIVYQARAILPGSTSDVVVRDMTGEPSVTLGAGDDHNQTNPDVSGGRVVYETDAAGNSDVAMYDAVNEFTTPIAATADEEVAPRISGNLVVWKNADTETLWYRDVQRGITAQVQGADHVTEFDVDCGRIAWAEAFVEEFLYWSEPGRLNTPQLVYSVASDRSVTSMNLDGDMIGTTLDGTSTNAVMIPLLGGGLRTYANDSREMDVFHDTLAMTYPVGGQEDIGFGSVGDPTTISFGSSTEDEHDPALCGWRIVYERVPSVVNGDIYTAVTDREIERTEGDDRYLTAIAASQEYFDSADYAIICTGRNFPDALAAGPLADAYDAPLLLTKPDAVSAALLDELDRLGVQNIVVIGGPAVVSDAVVTQLDATYNTVFRVAGDDRYETSALIAELMSQEIYSGSAAVHRAFFARGDNFPDALAVGPIAAGARAPILLVKPTSLPSSVADTVDELNLTSGFVIGGSDVVSEDVKDALRDLMIANGGDDHDPQIVERWAGADRYATAIQVVEHGLEAHWIDLDSVGIATGLNFPDALGGGAALGHRGNPLVLVKGPTLTTVVGLFANDHAQDIGRMDVFGGTDVVPASLVDDMRNALH